MTCDDVAAWMGFPAVSRPLTAVFAAAVAVFVLVHASVGLAQVPERKTKRVVVLPLRTLPERCRVMFESGSTEAMRWQKFHRTLESSLASAEDVTLVPFVDLRGSLSRRAEYRDKVVLGREFYLLAQEEYQDVRQAEAEAHLRRAVEILDDIYYDLVEPEAMAQILLLLGVTQVERGQAGQAHVSMRRALFLWPSLHVAKDYYPAAVEAALLNACEDLRESMGGFPLNSIERAIEFLRVNNLDTLLVTMAGAQSDGQTLDVVSLERSTGSVSYRESLVLPAQPDLDAEMASRLASRWVSCVPFEEKPRPKGRAERSWTFAGTYQNLAYLANPTRDLLFDWGFSFNGSHFFVPTFGLMGKLQFISSMPDPLGDLLEELRSVRLVVGPVFALTGEWWRLFVLPGAEAHALGSFRTSRDPDCKFYEIDSAGYEATCDLGRVKHYDLAVQGGIHLAVGGQIYFSNQLFLELSMSFSGYFLPINRSFELNFPVGIEAGGGIAF